VRVVSCELEKLVAAGQEACVSVFLHLDTAEEHSQLG
jgi:hypothetical protein